MIESTVGEQEPQEPKPFPKIMKATDNDTIIIVYGELDDRLIGTVISGNAHSIGFPSAWIKTNFEDYNEPITIKNK